MCTLQTAIAVLLRIDLSPSTHRFQYRGLTVPTGPPLYLSYCSCAAQYIPTRHPHSFRCTPRSSNAPLNTNRSDTTRYGNPQPASQTNTSILHPPCWSAPRAALPSSPASPLLSLSLFYNKAHGQRRGSTSTFRFSSRIPARTNRPSLTPANLPRRILTMHGSMLSPLRRRVVPAERSP